MSSALTCSDVWRVVVDTLPTLVASAPLRWGTPGHSSLGGPTDPGGAATPRRPPRRCPPGNLGFETRLASGVNVRLAPMPGLGRRPGRSGTDRGKDRGEETWRFWTPSAHEQW